MYQPYPVGSLDHLYHQLVVAARHFEEVSDEINWGPFTGPFIHLPLSHDVQDWEQWEHRYRLAENRMFDAEIAMLKALGQY